MEQHSFKIVTGVLPPRTNVCGLEILKPTFECPFPGVDSEILAAILNKFDANYTLIPYYELQDSFDMWKKSKDGEWEGLFGHLQKGTIDTMSYGNAMVPSRITKDFEFSFPIYSESITYLVGKSEVPWIKSATIILWVFHPKLWLTFITAFMCLVLLILLYSRNKRWPTMLWNLIRFTINQPIGDLQQRRFSGNILVTSVALLTVLLLGLYQGCLLTKLLYPITNRHRWGPFDVLDQVERGNYRFIHTGAGTFHWLEAQTSNSPYYKRLREIIKTQPPKIEPNLTLLVDFVVKQNFIYVSTESRVGYLSARDDVCSKVEAIPTEILGRLISGFLFRRGSPWIKKFNRNVIKYNTQIEYIVNKYRSQIKSIKCKKMEEDEIAKWKPLNFGMFSGIFFMFLIALSFAFVMFLIENAYWRQIKKLTSIVWITIKETSF